MNYIKVRRRANAKRKSWGTDREPGGSKVVPIFIFGPSKKEFLAGGLIRLWGRMYHFNITVCSKAHSLDKLHKFSFKLCVSKWLIDAPSEQELRMQQ